MRKKYTIIYLISFDRVEDANNITVEFANMIRANAVIHDYERELNLAIISVKLEDIPFSYVNSIGMATLANPHSFCWQSNYRLRMPQWSSKFYAGRYCYQ